MRKLEELQRVVLETREDGTQITRLPNTEEIMGKINEIVRYCNQLDKDKQGKPIMPAGTIYRG
ncbi:TPA: hypothetical protein ACGW7B_000528 [Bacillus nitratireducens]